MKLFDIAVDHSKGPYGENEVSSPIGKFHSSCQIGSWNTKHYKPKKYVQSPNLRIGRWETPVFDLELLVGNFNASVPEGYPEAEAWTMIWRLHSKAIIKDLSFVALFEPNTHIGMLERDPNSGEGLEAMSWNTDSIEQSLGTEDADFLFRRAQSHDWMPNRLASVWASILEGESSEFAIEYLSNGLRIAIPPLFAGDKIQIHFNVAWAPIIKIGKEDSITSWLVVDTPYTFALSNLCYSFKQRADMLKKFDRVKLITDQYRHEKATIGMTGYIIEVYPGNRYEVEFSDSTTGVTIAQVVISADEVILCPEK
jgi:hypothetical protein